MHYLKYICVLYFHHLAYLESKHSQPNMSQVLDGIVHADLDNQRPVATAAVLDGTVIIQMLRSRSMLTTRDCFADYFVSYILSWSIKGNVIVRN